MENLKEQAKKILDNTLQEFGAAGFLGEDGSIYQGAVRAVEIALTNGTVYGVSGAVHGVLDRDTYSFAKKQALSSEYDDYLKEFEIQHQKYSECKKLGLDSASLRIALGEFTKRELAKNDISEISESFESVCKRTMGFIDQSKHGWITEALFQFCENMDGATYTELNKFYHWLGGGSIQEYEKNPTGFRGGSFVHHLASMRSPAKRVYSKSIKSVRKENGKWFVN